MVTNALQYHRTLINDEYLHSFVPSFDFRKLMSTAVSWHALAVQVSQAVFGTKINSDFEKKIKQFGSRPR